MSALPHLEPVDDATLERMLRYALLMGGDQLQFRAGHRPTLAGLGGARTLRFRQLTVDDTRAIAGHLLARSAVPERLRESGCDAAQPILALAELRGEALFETRFERDRAGIALAVDVIRPLPAAVAEGEIEAVEP